MVLTIKYKETTAISKICVYLMLQVITKINNMFHINANVYITERFFSHLKKTYVNKSFDISCANEINSYQSIQMLLMILIKNQDLFSSKFIKFISDWKIAMIFFKCLNFHLVNLMCLMSAFAFCVCCVLMIVGLSC